MRDHHKTTVRVRNIVSDAGRESVQSFFKDHIPHEAKPMPVLSFSESTQFDMQVAAVFGKLKEVVGAIHWAIDFEDSMAMEAQGAPEMSEEFSRAVRIIQNVAVATLYRNSGIGHALVTYLEDRVRNQGVKLVIGVASGEDSASFFDRIGYTVLEENEDLQVPLSNRTLARLPLSGSGFRWFWKNI
jgi:ribosomal protein S18 acetylase RimI-like enzyme